VNTIDGPTKLVRQDAILGGMSIGQFVCGRRTSDRPYFYRRACDLFFEYSFFDIFSYDFDKKVACSLWQNMAYRSEWRDSQQCFDYILFPRRGELCISAAQGIVVAISVNGVENSTRMLLCISNEYFGIFLTSFAQNESSISWTL